VGFLDELTSVVEGPLDLVSGVVNGVKDGANFTGNLIDGKWNDALDDGRKLMGDVGDISSGLASLGFNVGGLPAAFEGSRSLSAESKVIQAALWAIAGMKLTTGTGTPCNGDEFRNSADRLEDVFKTLLDARPHSDRWDGTASQVYNAVNASHYRCAALVEDADLNVAVVLDTEAEQVTSARSTLDGVSQGLSDYDLATSWMNLCGPAGREAKLAADLAAVAVAMPICTAAMAKLVGESIANSMQVRSALDKYADAAKTRPAIPAVAPADTQDTPDTEDDPQTMTVTVTNPPGTVSVTVLIDGSPTRIELAPRAAVDMTESQLAEEILLISGLARQNAQAGQHLLVSGILQRLGHDRVSTRGYLEHELGLPSAEKALAEKAQLFATRYAGEEE